MNKKNKKMKVYILWDYDLNDDRTIAVFANKKDAEIMMKDLKQNAMVGQYRIEEYTVIKKIKNDENNNWKNKQ